MKAELSNEWVEEALPATPEEVKTSKPAVIRHQDQPMPEVYYDAGRKEILMQEARGVWIGLNISQFSRKCRLHGISSKTIDGCCHSAFDHYADNIQDKKSVDLPSKSVAFETGYQLMVPFCEIVSLDWHCP
jgi:hypothetical protein